MIDPTISHYRIVEELSGGGMGVVYIERGVHLDSANNLLRIPFQVLSVVRTAPISLRFG